MVKIHHLPLATLAVAVASVSYFPHAMAQESYENGSSAGALEEIVVTARRREENLQDVPVAVTAMGEELLRTQNITQIENLGTKVPSLRISSAGASTNEPLISLRGQRPAESVFNQDQAVPMYFNEVVMAPTQGTNLGMYDLQGLQVVKGPQGTLFGRNSTGGAIILTPKRPGDELAGYVEVKAGNYGLMGYEGAVDVPVTENLQMRVAAHKLDRDGYQTNVADNALNGKDYRDEHSDGVRLSINYSQDGFSNLFVFAQDENKVRAAVPVPAGFNSSVGLGASAVFYPAYGQSIARQIARDNPWKIETDIDSEEYVKNVFVSNTTEFDLSDNVTLKNVFGYRKVDFETATDADGTAFNGWGTPTAGAVTFDPTPTVLGSEFYSNEIQLLGTALDDQLDWITGVYVSKTDATQDYSVQNSPFMPAAGLFPGRPTGYDVGVSNAINESYGVFGEATYTFTEQWSVTAGVRQSWDKRELTVSKWTDLARTNCAVVAEGQASTSTLGVLDNPAPGCERSVDESYSSPTWRVSANYTPIDGQLVYASVSTGYRAGGFNTRGKNDETLKPFDEEVVTTYEVGHKADWDLSWASVRTNVAVYLQDYEDIHQTRAYGNGGSDTRTENAAKAEIKGVEFDVTVAPTDNLMLNLSYSYVDAAFKEKTDIIDGEEVDTSDNEFTYIPEQSASASVSYTLPVDASLGEMSFLLGYYWQDKMSTNLLIDQFGIMPNAGGTSPWSAADVTAMTDLSEIDGYGVWNVRYDWRGVMGSNFDVAAYMDNVRDEEYVLGGLNIVDSGGYGAYTYGAPRTVGASVRYSF